MYETAMQAAADGYARTLPAIQPTLSSQLQSKKERLESELEQVNSALDALNANPEVARTLELTMKALSGRF